MQYGNSEQRPLQNQVGGWDRKAYTNTDRHAMARYANSDSKGSSERSAYRNEETTRPESHLYGDNLFKERKKSKQEKEEKKIGIEQVVNPDFAHNAAVKQEVSVSEKQASEKTEETTGTNKKKANLACHEIAEYLLATGNFRVENDNLMHYKEKFGYWKVVHANVDYRELRGCIPKEFYGSINRNSLSEIYEWLILAAEPFHDNPKAKNYINLSDVAIDWHNNEATTERKALCFRYYLQVEEADLYTESTGRFENFLETVFQEDKESQTEFLKFWGICLAGIRDQKLIFMAHGKSNSGKSILLSVISKLFGTGLVSALSFSQLAHEFSLTKLLGCSVNVTTEASGVSLSRLDVVKSLSGNDIINCCHKFKGEITAFPRCLLVFASNVFPAIRDTRELRFFLDRTVIYPFDNSVDRKNWIPDYDLFLLEERGSMIRYAVQGLCLWEADSYQINESKAMLAKKKEFRNEFDSFSLFAEEYVQESPDSKVSSQEISRLYSNYCNREGLIPLAANSWPVVLKQMFHVKEIIMNEYDSQKQAKARRRGYQGIKILCQAQEEDYIVDKIFKNKGGIQDYGN